MLLIYVIKESKESFFLKKKIFFNDIINIIIIDYLLLSENIVMCIIHV